METEDNMQDQEEAPVAQVVTAAELLAELAQKHFPESNNLKSGDEQRLEAQMAEGVINPILLARILGIQPQYVYAAIASGKLPTIGENDTQKKRIAVREAARWAAMYLTRKAQRDLAAYHEARSA
jgi:hypothetical protein